MSVFDFIRKPTAQSNPTVIAPSGPAIVPQYPTPPTSLGQTTVQAVPVVPISLRMRDEVGTQGQAIPNGEQVQRQAYVANLLQQYPQVSTLPHTGVALEVKSDTPTSTPPQANAKVVVGNDGGQMSRQEMLDMMTHLGQRANKVLSIAQTKAKEVQSEVVDSEHILAGLLADVEVVRLLTEMKVQVPTIEAALGQMYKRAAAPTTPQISPRVKKIIEMSLADARKSGIEFIAPEHLLLALFEEGEGVGARLLAKLGIQLEDLQKRVTSQVAAQNQGSVNADGTITKPNEPKKSALAGFTIDITAKAENGELDAVVERSEEIERVVQVLSRRTKNNPALVGEPGVGKTAILEGLAQRIAARQVPEALLGKRILQLDLMSVLAGASHRGEFEQRMKDLIEEVVASNGKYIMFIDEMHTIVGAGSGGEGSLDAANFLKPALARGELQMIGATTLTEYRKYVEKDPALERRFQTIQIPEPSEEAAIKMLKALRPKYEKFHKVQIPDEAVEAAVKLSKRYVGDRFLPDKAIDLIDEAAASVRLPIMSLPERIASLEERIVQLQKDKAAAEGKNDKVRTKVLTSKIATIEPKLAEMKLDYETKKNQSTVSVTEGIIKDVVSRWTGVPVSKLSGSESDKLIKLESIMHERMIGQDRAVKAVSAAVRRGRAGLKSNMRPIGSFIFLGPSGVGKTELTKTLAEVLFGQEDAMIRFDMTEFMEKHEVAKLIGPPPGYVGYEEGGKLTEAVRRKPYSVVLFDEVEKAHPDIFNILLQVLDDGRLTDNKGRTISFKNTVVICTSNIGTQLIQEKLLKQQAENKDKGTRIREESRVSSVEVVAGKQSDKRIQSFEEQNREFTDMKDADVAQQYRGAPAHFDEAELQVGYEFEDEVGDDMSANDYNDLKDLVMGELRKFFRSELINRFDEVIVFEPLQFKHMQKIVELQLKTLVKLLEEQNLGLTITDAAKEQIVIAGFDPVYGARPLRRAIQKLLENPISEMIIAKKAQDGDIILVDYTDDFVFKTEKPTQIVTEESKDSFGGAQDKLQSKTKVRSEDNKPGEVMPMYAMYKCVESGLKFETAVVPNSTIICPTNAKEKAVPVSDSKPESEGQVTEQQVATAQVSSEDHAQDFKAQPADVATNYMNAYQAAT